MKYLEIACDELPLAMDWVRSTLKDTSLSQKEKAQVELALEEAIVNILSHGFESQRGKVQLSFHQTTTHVEFELKDAGKPFNPLEHVQKLQEGPLEQRKEGGLGILLISAYVEMRYRRHENTNILTLSKKLT